jgi:hypothetical protein
MMKLYELGEIYAIAKSNKTNFNIFKNWRYQSAVDIVVVIINLSIQAMFIEFV